MSDRIHYVYLAGRMTGLADRGASWRLLAARLLLPHAALDPLLLELPSHRPQDIVRTDVAAIARSSAVLAYVGVPSWGTAMELWQARQLAVPVVAWAEPRDLLDCPLSPWAQYVIDGGMHDSMESAAETVRRMLSADV